MIIVKDCKLRNYKYKIILIDDNTNETIKTYYINNKSQKLFFLN